MTAAAAAAAAVAAATLVTTTRATMTGRQRALGLYRSLLRAHKNHLPADMRQLGDSYVKSEFQLHKSAKKAEHLTAFFREWENYLEELLRTARTRDAMQLGTGGGTTMMKMDPFASSPQSLTAAVSFGKDLPQDVVLQEEQKAQLEQLKREAERLASRDK
jgi:Complex1_LYR-like